MESKPIDVFNYGKMIRDFTYIDDVIESLYRIIKKPPRINDEFDFIRNCPSESFAPYKLFNIGNSKPTSLIEFITKIEEKLGIEAIKDYCEMQQGDVACTFADTSEIEEGINFKPNTPMEHGISEFINWDTNFYQC